MLSKLLVNKEDIVNEIEGPTIEEKTSNIIKWFMHDDASDKPKCSTSPKSKVLGTCKRTKHQKQAHQLDAHKNLNETNQEKSKRKKRSCDDKEKQKAILIESTQEDNSKLPSIGCTIRMLVGYGENGEMNATIITTKEDVDYKFWYRKRSKVIKEYKNIRGNYSWGD